MFAIYVKRIISFPPDTLYCAGTPLVGTDGLRLNFDDTSGPAYDGQICFIGSEERSVGEHHIESRHAEFHDGVVRGYGWYCQPPPPTLDPPFLMTNDLSQHMIYADDVDIRVEETHLPEFNKRAYIAIVRKSWLGLLQWERNGTSEEPKDCRLTAYSHVSEMKLRDIQLIDLKNDKMADVILRR